MRAGAKILHQVWIQGEAELPMRYRENRAEWREVLPRDWQMVLWDEESARASWPDYAVVSERCYHHATRADLILARAQRDFGGLACGTDVRPKHPEDLLVWCELNGTLVVIHPREQSASNGISYFGAPGNPFLICLCKHQLRSGGQHLGSKNVWAATGPGCWYRAFCASRWDLSLATDLRAYGVQGFVDPGADGSWHGEGAAAPLVSAVPVGPEQIVIMCRRRNAQVENLQRVLGSERPVHVVEAGRLPHRCDGLQRIGHAWPRAVEGCDADKWTWFIEDDVAGPAASFARLFQSAARFRCDLLANEVQWHQECPQWPHWKQARGADLPRARRSFNPLCRLSPALLKRVRQWGDQRGRFLFHEILFAALAETAGDFARVCPNAFGRFAWRPAIEGPTVGICHPVKDAVVHAEVCRL